MNSMSQWVKACAVGEIDEEDVLDHRLNTRTVYMNPVIRFLY